MRSLRIVFVLGLFFGLATYPARAQEPPAAAAPPAAPPVWAGSFGFGLTLTRGNTDTTDVNLSFDTKYTPSAANVFKAEGLYLRGRTDGDDTANRLAVKGRMEHLLGKRAFVFGQLQYLRDPFKGIDYLVSPTVGAGYKIVDTPAVQFAADTSLGAVWEKNPDVDVKASPAWAAGEKLAWKLSTVATLTQGAQALWKLNDFGDTLYTFSLGLASEVTKHTQLKAEFLDTYKTAPPAGSESNDASVLVSLVFKY